MRLNINQKRKLLLQVVVAGSKALLHAIVAGSKALLKNKE